LFVDVKTIQPKPTDRWDQFENAQKKQRFPENVEVVLRKEGLGGELWHSMDAARSRMLEYAHELEGKITDGNLTNRNNAFFIMAFCGEGFNWREAELEKFVAFYKTGLHRVDDKFSKMELHDIQEKGISLTRTITQFACISRPQLAIRPTKVNWNVRHDDAPFI